MREKVRKAKLALTKHEENLEQKKKLKEKEEAKIKCDDDEFIWRILKSDDEDEESVADMNDVSNENHSWLNIPGKASAIANKDSVFYLQEDMFESVHDHTNFAAASVDFIAKPEGPSRRPLPVHELPPTIVPYAKTYSWVPHPFDKPEISYSMMCPYGGPGGLICCEGCTSRYSGYLTKTVKDIERQRLDHMGLEVKELLEFTINGKLILAESVKVARRTPVPLHGGATVQYDRWTTSSSSKRKDPPADVDDRNAAEKEAARDLANLATQTAII